MGPHCGNEGVDGRRRKSRERIVGRRVPEGAYRSCRSHDAALCPALEWTPLAVTIPSKYDQLLKVYW